LNRILIYILILICVLSGQKTIPFDNDVIKKINSIVKEADIPEINIILSFSDSTVILKSEDGGEIRVVDDPAELKLYEIGSASKSFTGLALLKLESEGKVNLNDPVIKYIPDLSVYFQGEQQTILISHLLHHTSGIPWNTISKIRESSSDNALEETVLSFSGSELARKPGLQYEYATINYDIIGLIIEKVSGLKFEEYLKDNIFLPLGMSNTSVGIPVDQSRMTEGNKISYFKARKYNAPVFKGNWPAGYVITDAADMTKWIGFQTGKSYDPILSPLIVRSHARDETVPPVLSPPSSYAAGWTVSLQGDGIISHRGLNPNFTSYIGFIPGKVIGTAVLSNSNSGITELLGDYILKVLSGDQNVRFNEPGKSDDDVYSLFSIIFTALVLVIAGFIISVLSDIVRKKRTFMVPGKRKLLSLLFAVLASVPVFAGIYMIPFALAGFSWQSAFVWMPLSFEYSVYLLVITISGLLLAFFISSLFPPVNKYKKSLPLVIVLSLLSGISNSLVIFIIVNSVYAEDNVLYLLFYFCLVMVIYIAGRKIVQVKLIEISYGIIYDIRVGLIEKIFSTSYQKFQEIDRGRVYATLNHDTNILGTSANIFVNLSTSTITTLSVFIYLGFISLWPTLITLGVILFIGIVYYFISESAEKFYNKARDTHNVYMDLLNGLLDGFKELCINRFKKKEYKKEVESTVRSFKDNTVSAEVKFVNAILVGESFLILALGFVSFMIPELFPEIQRIILMSFIMVLMYLIGPINTILMSIPALIQLKVSWNRIQGFIKGIPLNDDYNMNEVSVSKTKTIESLELKDIEFDYKNRGEHDKFGVGPISFKAQKGEIIFIIGGNGSGKTTLANLMTGLYKPDKGYVEINGESLNGVELGEKYSIVFSDYNIFSRLYNIDTDAKKDTINEYFEKFYLQDKVKLENGAFSTTKLSNGQRKRLALIKCFLEDSPVFLFDEVAADQDPDFKRYFYTDLLMQLKKEGKIIIAITHDDHYFDVADKIIKLDRGHIDEIKINRK